jgi:hypothetical protein
VIPLELAPIVVVPAAMQFATPATLGALAMVATLAEDELQWVFRVMSCVLPSLKVPVATNCWIPPAVAVGVAGVTATDDSVPVPIVKVVVPVTPEADAEMVTTPPFFPWAIPVERTDAMLGFEDFHEIPLRLVATLPSLKVPVAVNLMVVPFEIRGLAGVMAIETKVVFETVNPVEPLTEPRSAFMVVLPVATLDASPWAVMVAAAGFEDVQTTDALISWVDESLKVPVAVNCFVVPTAMLEFAGVIAIDTSVAPVTVSDAVPVTDADVAAIVVVPVPTLVASPAEFTVATEAEVEDQVAPTSSCVLPSSKLPMALNCCELPMAMD